MKYLYTTCRESEFPKLARKLLDKKIRVSTRRSAKKIILHVRIPRADLNKFPEGSTASTFIQSDFSETEFFLYGPITERWTKLTEEWLSTYEVIER
jgi:hypothetical protein